MPISNHDDRVYERERSISMKQSTRTFIYDMAACVIGVTIMGMVWFLLWMISIL